MQIFLQLFSIKFALLPITRKWRNNDQEDTIRQAIARQVPFSIEGLFFYYPFRNFLEWVVIFSRVGWGRTHSRLECYTSGKADNV